MLPHVLHLALTVCTGLALVVATPCGAAATSVDDLAALCRAAKTEFRPLTDADLQQAKVELLAAASRLDERLKAAGQTGSDWRKFVQWDRMQAQLTGDQAPDLRELEQVHKIYASGYEGLGLVWFLDVRNALYRYVGTARVVHSPGLKANYEKLMDGLADRLESYAQNPTAEDALYIGSALRWLDDARQATVLTEAIRDRFQQPNLFMQVSAAVAGAGIAAAVDETEPVRDVILKTDIFGTGHTTGQISLQLADDPDRGVFDTLFLGTVWTRNVGYNGPARIYSTGTTRIGACKRLWLSTEGLSSLPAVSNAVTETTITGIGSSRGSRLVERIACKRVGKQKGQAEQIASLHAQQRANARMDRQASETIARANEEFTGKFRQPLLERKLFPPQLQFSTNPEALLVRALQADAFQLGAPAAAPELLEGTDLAVRAHESMLNNLAASALGGMMLRQEVLEAALVDFLGSLPEQLESDEEGEPWAITFAQQQPVSVTFADNQFRLTLRGAKYVRGEKSYPGMNVTVCYQIEKTDQGFKALRQGPLEVFPPRSAPGTDYRLSGQEVVIRDLLRKRFEKLFKEELTGTGLTLPGKWSKAGKLQPVQWDCNGGWMTIAWRRVPDAATVASASDR